MKKQFFLLASLLIIVVPMLFSQNIELKKIASTTKFPDGILDDGVTFSNMEILDVIGNYLVCKRPLHIFNVRTNICLLAKDLSSVKYVETPEEYAAYTPIYLCKVGDYYFFRLVKNAKQYTFAIYDKNLKFVKTMPMGEFNRCIPVYLGTVGGNHFVKFAYGKKFALATFDERINLLKVEPMGIFGRVYCDDEYIYLQNISVKAKQKDIPNGELIKMDKDMNVITRKPVTALWEKAKSKPLYLSVDTFGHLVCNCGRTYITVDKETLEQAKLDLRSGERSYHLSDTVVYDTDKILRIVSHITSLSVSVCDYNGNEMQNRSMEIPFRKQTCSFLEYKNNKVYVLLSEKTTVSIVGFDIESGATDTVSSFQLEQNPGYTCSVNLSNYDYKDYEISTSLWKYNNNSYNLVLTTERHRHQVSPVYQPRSKTYINEAKDYYDGYLSFIHLDENFQFIKLEEESYLDITSKKLCASKVLHYFGDYSLLMEYKPAKGMISDVQFVIWDQFGNRKVVLSHQKARFAPGGQYSTYRRGDPLYTPIIYKFSPNRYYILTGIYNNAKDAPPFTLTELTVKP